MTSSLSLEPLIMAGVHFDIDRNNRVVILSQPTEEREKDEKCTQSQSSFIDNSPYSEDARRSKEIIPDQQPETPNIDWNTIVPQFLECLV